MIDCHCHLKYPGEEIESRILDEAKKEMTAIVACGYPRDWQKTLEICRKNEGFIFLSLGLHPIDIEKMTDDEIEKYFDIIKNHGKEIVAIGEIGLDYHWYKDEKLNERFREVFIRCLELSKELKLPAVLHLRKAEEEGFKIITEQGIENADFHCYSGNITLAKQIIENGYYISLATNINNSKNSETIAKKFPLEKLLTETDSPFLSPVKDKPNVPQNVKLVIEKIAELRKMSFEEVDKITTENAKRFFNIHI